MVTRRKGDSRYNIVSRVRQKKMIFSDVALNQPSLSYISRVSCRYAVLYDGAFFTLLFDVFKSFFHVINLHFEYFLSSKAFTLSGCESSGLTSVWCTLREKKEHTSKEIVMNFCFFINTLQLKGTDVI